MLQLRDGHVVMRAQTVFQAAQNLPLVLEGLRIEDVNFQGEEADRHFRWRNNARWLVNLHHQEISCADANCVAAYYGLTTTLSCRGARGRAGARRRQAPRSSRS